MLGHHSDFLDVVEGLAVGELQTRVCPPLAEVGRHLNTAILHVLLLRRETIKHMQSGCVLEVAAERLWISSVSFAVCVCVCVCVCV